MTPRGITEAFSLRREYAVTHSLRKIYLETPGHAGRAGFVPIALWGNYLGALERGVFSLEDISPGGRYWSMALKMAAYSSWRLSQGVYRFHPALRSALTKNCDRVHLSEDITNRIPEYCVYIEHDTVVDGMQMVGFWAFVDSDMSGNQRLCLKFSDGSDNTVDFWSPILKNGSDSVPEDLGEYKDGKLIPVEPEAFAPSYEAANLVAYLCAVNADFVRPQKEIAPVATKRGKFLLPPRAQRVFEVGAKIGESLTRPPSVSSDSVRHRPVPHMRRAHWHRYVCGAADARRLELRWIAPTLVGHGEVTRHVVRDLSAGS